MKQQFRLYRRSNGGRFYLHDNVTGKQESLGTTDRAEATRLLHAKNEAARQPLINVQIARAYLAANDAQVGTRNWQTAMHEIAKARQGTTQEFYFRAFKQSAFDSIRKLPIVQTRPEHFMRVLEAGTVSAEKAAAQIVLREAGYTIRRAINTERGGNQGEALRIYRSLFGSRFPLP